MKTLIWSVPLVAVMIMLGLLWRGEEAPTPLPSEESITADMPPESSLNDSPQSTRAEPSALPTAVKATEKPPKIIELLQEVQEGDYSKVFSQPLEQVFVGNIDGAWVTHGDILVDEKRLIKGVGSQDVGLAQMSGVQYWHKGIVPYMIDADLDRHEIESAMKEMMSKTTVQFVERSDEKDYLRFQSTAKKATCLSYLGRNGDEQELLLHPESCKKGHILHELMHALGFAHEHSREDRDRFVKILWPNIDPAYHNQLQKLSAAISMPVPGKFDFESIMLYPSQAFLLEGARGFSITKRDDTSFTAQRESLSAEDIRRVNALYPAESKSNKL